VVLVAPSGHRREDGDEVATLWRQFVATVAVCDDVVFFERIESLRECTRVEAFDRTLKFGETTGVGGEITKDESGPFLADDIHGGLDAAGSSFERGYDVTHDLLYKVYHKSSKIARTVSASPQAIVAEAESWATLQESPYGQRGRINGSREGRSGVPADQFRYTGQVMTETTNTEHILWLDFEMTGLDADKDKIVEVAMIVTDWDFNEIAEFHSGFHYDAPGLERLLSANPFYVKMKENKVALLKLSSASPAVQVVEKEMVQFIREHCGSLKPVLLCGNSIHMDRQFVRAQLPLVEQLLHYRMLDVTAWKLVFEAKYGKQYVKQETHRALDDVRESIGELKYYLESVA